MNHIPGPWFYALENGKDSVFANDMTGGDPWTICHCVDPLMDGPKWRKRERLANAQLIAAAPDLLEALKELVESNDEFDKLFPDLAEESQFRSDRIANHIARELKAESAARAAIAKAEGKEGP